jgi:hypothetical protein
VASTGAALLITMAALVLAFGAPLRPSGGVAGLTGTPGPFGPDRGGFVVPTDSGDATAPDPSGSTRPTRTGSGGTPAAGPTTAPMSAGTTTAGGDPAPTEPPATATPAAGATPPPTLRPTPNPTPDSTPNPTSAPTLSRTPAPPRCLATAPNLVGRHRSTAAQLWTEAGFTGKVTALDGHGNYVIASQDRTAGASYPCDTAVTIGP